MNLIKMNVKFKTGAEPTELPLGLCSCLLSVVVKPSLILAVEAEHTEHRAENLAVIHNDGFHGVVLRL